MEKSFNLIVKETKQKLIDVINESKLPTVVSAMIINEMLQAVNTQAIQQTKNEERQYEESLKDKAKNIKK